MCISVKNNFKSTKFYTMRLIWQEQIFDNISNYFSELLVSYYILHLLPEN